MSAAACSAHGWILPLGKGLPWEGAAWGPCRWGVQSRRQGLGVHGRYSLSCCTGGTWPAPACGLLIYCFPFTVKLKGEGAPFNHCLRGPA